MTITNVEVSFYRYLYEQLEVPYGIKLFESTNLTDFSECEEWVVVDPLSNPLGQQPKQLYFLHAAVQKGGAEERLQLSRLVDKVVATVEQGSRIDVYDYDTELIVGEMEICEVSMSPIMQHTSGGSYRSITLGVVYACN